MHDPNDGFWWQASRHAHEAWWHGPLTAIAILLLIGLLVAGIVWLVRRSSPAAPASAGPAVAVGLAVDPAVAALRMRYARGEIARDDYQLAMADLAGAEAQEPGGTADTTAG